MTVATQAREPRVSSYHQEIAPPALLTLLICQLVHVSPLSSVSLIQLSLLSSRLMTHGSKGLLAATDLVQILDLPVSSSCLFLDPDNVEASTLARAG